MTNLLVSAMLLVTPMQSSFMDTTRCYLKEMQKPYHEACVDRLLALRSEFVEYLKCEDPMIRKCARAALRSIDYSIKLKIGEAPKFHDKKEFNEWSDKVDLESHEISASFADALKEFLDAIEK